MLRLIVLKKELLFSYIYCLDKIQMKTNGFPGSKTVGNYTVLLNEPLGKGATGIVYKGNDSTTQAFIMSPNSQSPSRPST